MEATKRCFFILVIVIMSISTAQADQIVSLVGADSPTGLTSLSRLFGSDLCCTAEADGWITDPTLDWTHTFDASGIQTINSATLVFDILDADAGNLTVSNGGITIGSAIGGSTGGPGAWHQFGDNPNGGVDNGDGSVVNTFVLNISNTTILNNLLSGSFAVNGVNTNNLGAYGINQAILTIEFDAATVPEPGSLFLLGFAMLGLAFRRRK